MERDIISNLRNKKNAHYWDRAFQSGKLDHLRQPAEQLRLGSIAAMVADAGQRYGPVRLIDIGCGEGLLLPFVSSGSVAEYVAVDLSQIALENIPKSDIPVKKIAAGLADLKGFPATAGPLVMVASEVLYYDENGVDHLHRLAKTADCREVIISCVAGHADKPNWEAASRKLWAELARTDWHRVETKIIKEAELQWDIARYKLD